MTADAGGMYPVPLKMTGKLDHVFQFRGSIELKEHDTLDIADPAVRPPLQDEPRNNWTNSAEEEEPDQVAVYLATRELALRTNNTPLN